MKRFFRKAGPTSRQELERQAAEELRAASGLPKPALPAQDHPAAQGRTDEKAGRRRAGAGRRRTS